MVSLILEQIRIYGERAAIMEDLGWIDAFKRGWQVIVENLGATIVLWIIFFALSMLIFIIVLGIILLFVTPFLALFWWTAPGKFPSNYRKNPSRLEIS